MNIPQKARIEGRGRGERAVAASDGQQFRPALGNQLWAGERGRGRPERDEDEGIDWKMSKEEAKEINIKGREECRLKKEQIKKISVIYYNFFQLI